MTTRRITGYYVRAVRGAGSHAEWRALVGPFRSHSAAFRMVVPVERACQRHGIYKNCTFGVWRGAVGPGRLALDKIDIMDVIEESRR